MIVISFDRDATVDTGVPPGPVPVEWVRFLAGDPGFAVYAHGNQALKEEAGIEGTTELLVALGRNDVDDRSAHAAYHDRLERVRLAGERHPDADLYVCVDDVDLSELQEEGWLYHTPAGFVETYAHEFSLLP